MKAYKILTSIALGAAFLSSCSSDDTLLENPNYPADNVVRVTAQVDEPSSRSMTTDKLKEFYLSIKNSVNSTYTYNNVKFEKTDGVWTPEKQLLWQNATQKVTVKAKTWSAELDFVKVTKDQSTLENFDKSDHLWFYVGNFVPGDKLNNDKKMNINFKHALSLFEIQVAYGTEFNVSSPLEASAITNMKVNGDIWNTCEVVDNGSTITIRTHGEKSDFIPYHNGFTSAANQTSHAVDNFSCILVPQTITAGNFIVEFVANGKFYQWKSTANITLETGKKYQLNLVLGKDLVMAGNITPTAWNDQDGGDLETE